MEKRITRRVVFFTINSLERNAICHTSGQLVLSATSGPSSGIFRTDLMEGSYLMRLVQKESRVKSRKIIVNK